MHLKMSSDHILFKKSHMKKSFGWKKIIFSILILALLIVGVWFYRFWFVDQGLDNRKYIPKNATLEIQLNGKQLFQTGLKALFSGEDDPAFDKQFDEFWDKQKQQGGPGIDFNQTVYAFQTVENGIPILGVIALVDNEKWFEKEWKTDNSVGYAINEDCVMMLFSLKPSKQKLNLLAQKYLSNPSAVSGMKTEKTLTIQSKNWNIDSKTVTTVNPLEIQIEKQKIKLSGAVKTNETLIPSGLNWRLIPNHAHVSSAIPSQAQVSLKEMLQFQKITLPSIDYVAINYAKLTVEEVDTEAGILFNPDCQVLLHFNEKINLDSLFQFDEKWKKLGLYQNKQLIRGSTIYHMVTPDPYTLFVGTDKNALQSGRPNHVCAVQGDLVNFTKIEGGGMITMLASVYPPFRAFRGLTQEMKQVSIQLEEKEGKVELQGIIETKEKTNLFKESLKFYWQLAN